MTVFSAPDAGGSPSGRMPDDTHGKPRAASGRKPDGQDALVERLRTLDWPKPESGVRERCLADFERRLARLQADGLGVASEERLD